MSNTLFTQRNKEYNISAEEATDRQLCLDWEEEDPPFPSKPDSNRHMKGFTCGWDVKELHSQDYLSKNALMSTKPNTNDLKLFTNDLPSKGEGPMKDLNILLDENFEITSLYSTPDPQVQDSKPTSPKILDFINFRNIYRSRTNEKVQPKTVPTILGTSKTHSWQKIYANPLRTSENLTEKYKNSSNIR